MRIGVIGCGTIASAAVQGIAMDGHQITVSDRSAGHASRLADAYANVRIADNQGVLDASDTIFLGLMAEAAPDVLGALSFRAEQTVISFMAGASLDAVGSMVRPARMAAVMMPFPGIANGGSPILVQGDVDKVREIFGGRNTIFSMQSDAEMAAYLCAQAVLSPVALMVSDASNWLGHRAADKDQGETFLRALVASSLAETRSEVLIEALNTPGGYNQRLRLHMEASGMSAELARGLTALE